MAVLTQSVIDRVDHVTSDPQRKRFRLADIATFINEAQSLIAEVAARASAKTLAFTMGAGAHQDLRTDTATRWIRLHEVVCHADNSGAPTGPTLRRMDRGMLDRVDRAWRSASPVAQPVEYAQDETLPFEFDLYPPAVAGGKLFVVASVRPADICALNPGGTALANPSEVIGLNDGFDIPMVDWVLYRLFSRETSDQAYQVRAKDHFAAAQAALGVTLKDAS